MDLIEKAWEALKQECCSDPKKAQRCVMVSKAAFIRAIKSVQEKK